jgi:hypothetical protein
MEQPKLTNTEVLYELLSYTSLRPEISSSPESFFNLRMLQVVTRDATISIYSAGELDTFTELFNDGCIVDSVQAFIKEP